VLLAVLALTPAIHGVEQQEPAAPAAAAEAEAATTEQDLFEQEELTGDWGGTRAQWKDKGFELDFSVTQFFQGVVDGGIETGSEYNGTAQATLEFDLGKLVGFKFWSAEVKGELRFGGPLLGGTGTVSPVNTAALIPAADGEVASLTALNLTRLIPIDLQKGNLVAVAFGRFNFIDLLDEDFFAGGGTERFWNMAQIGPLTVLREVPLISYAASVAYVRAGEPIFTFAIIDPNDYSTTTGFDDIFGDGVTFSPGVNFPVKYFGKSAKHTIGGAITTKEYTPFDAIRQIIIPGPPIDPVEPEDGSWSVNYVFRQYIVERGHRDGWGFFSQVAFANESTSPISAFFDLGLGGNGLVAARPHDEFGIAYAYTDLSDELKDNLALLPPRRDPLRVEHQVEMFYNFHLTPWFQLTGNLQIIRPTRPVADTAIIPGASLRIVF
jgi:porin